MVGAGITGLSAAYFLARQGARVTVLERGSGPGAGATGRSAGQINPIGPELPSILYRTLGQQATHDLFRMLRRSLTLLEQTAAREQFECGLVSVPLHHLARRAPEWEQIQVSMPIFEALGARPRLLPASAAFLGGVELPNHARLDPMRLAQGLADAISAHHGMLYVDTPADGITAQADGALLLSTPRGQLSTEYVIHSTGWSAGGEWIFPVRGQMLWTDPAPEVSSANCIANGGYDYWHQQSDGRVLIGGMRYLEPEMECGLSERGVNPKISSALAGFLEQAYPQLRPVTPAGHWSGIMAYTGDELPLVGSLPGHARQLVAAGMCGDGLAYGMATGEALAGRILGHETDYPWELFSPRRLL